MPSLLCPVYQPVLDNGRMKRRIEARLPLGTAHYLGEGTDRYSIMDSCYDWKDPNGLSRPHLVLQIKKINKKNFKRQLALSPFSLV